MVKLLVLIILCGFDGMMIILRAGCRKNPGEALSANIFSPYNHAFPNLLGVKINLRGGHED